MSLLRIIGRFEARNNYFAAKYNLSRRGMRRDEVKASYSATAKSLFTGRRIIGVCILSRVPNEDKKF